MSTHNHRGGVAQRSYNKFPTKGDGRGASTVTRAKPVGADPLALSEGVNDTAASQDFLKAQRERLASTRK